MKRAWRRSSRPVRSAGLSIDGSVSYLNFQYTSVAPGANQTLLTDPFAGAPKWKWTLGAQYVANIDGFGSITPRIDAAYQDQVYSGTKYQ